MKLRALQDVHAAPQQGERDDPDKGDDRSYVVPMSSEELHSVRPLAG